jgi:DNA-binding CsgD family transcriptional regulator
LQRTKEREREAGEALPGVSADRLVHLLTTFSALRRDGQALIDQIRGSLHEMRELRNQLQEHHTPLRRAGRNGTQRTRNAHLQLRYGLTARELEVAVLLAQGCSNASIADALQISAHTARHHTQRILAKLGVHSRSEAGAKMRG